MNSVGELFQLLEPYKVWAVLIGTLTSVGFTAFRWFAKRLRIERAMHDSMAEALVQAEEKINRLTRRVQASEQFDPADWLIRADRQVRAGEDDQAIRQLKNDLAGRQEALGIVFAKVSDHHLVSYPLDVEHLHQARRYAKLAMLIDPASHEGERLRQIEATMAMRRTRLRQIDEQVESGLSELTLAIGKLSQADALAHVDDLLRLHLEHLDRGQFLISERLAQRAQRVAESVFGRVSQPALKAHIRWVVALQECGLYEQGLAEIDRCILDFSKLPNPPKHELLVAEYVKVQLLDKFGRVQEAMAQIDDVLQRRQAFSGQHEPDTFATRLLRASILIRANQHARALAEANWLIENERDSRGATVMMIAAREVKSNALAHLGMIEEACRELATVVSLAKAELGLSHPMTLAYRENLARVLAVSGKETQALKEMDDLIEVGNRVLWTTHPDQVKRRIFREKVLLVVKGESTFQKPVQ